MTPLIDTHLHLIYRDTPAQAARSGANSTARMGQARAGR